MLAASVNMAVTREIIALERGSSRWPEDRMQISIPAMESTTSTRWVGGHFRAGPEMKQRAGYGNQPAPNAHGNFVWRHRPRTMRRRSNAGTADAGILPAH